jgi:hypothetical protein
MMKKWLSTLMCITVVFSVLLAACGSTYYATETPVTEARMASEETPEVEKAQKPVGEFAIYAVGGGISAQQMMETDLDDLEVENNPVLSVDDIVTYTEKTHSIELTDAAYEKISGSEIDLIGTPFVVFVGREPIYAGVFWAAYLSRSFDGIVIDILPAMDKRPIRIQLGYPESLELFIGDDLRSDSRILLSIDAVSKLK